MTQIEEKVSNKQVLAAGHITGNPKQSDMYLRTSTISLQLSPEASNSVLVKNLYLSCDPYMRGTKTTDNKTRLFYSFSPDSLNPFNAILLSGPAALEAMFTGRSAGKQVVLLAHE
ncbi:unnamed protein product [Lupinus luteus]|uniref:Oxidoreductase N-terminal domain-containing protein n=1 Tax=Lupinus luteus TaxID=3873 RepID=A0AAV1X4D5_LUPLU